MIVAEAQAGAAANFLLDGVLISVAAIGLSVSLLLWGLWLRQRHEFFFSRWLRSYLDRPTACWGLPDLLIAMGTMLTFDTAAGVISLQIFPGETETDLAGRLALFGVARLATLVITIAWLFGRYRITGRELGLSLRRFKTDLSVAGASAMLFLPPILALQMVLSLVIEYEHITKTQLESYAGLWVFAGAMLSAGIAAPLWEEFLYRGLLQGWLMRMSVAGDQETKSVLLGGRSQASEPAKPHKQSPAISPGPESLWWPIFVSAGIFAFMHLGQGAAPLPLFCLGLALGWLYRETRQLTPCILVHLVLNVWSLSSIMLRANYG